MADSTQINKMLLFSEIKTISVYAKIDDPFKSAPIERQAPPKKNKSGKILFIIQISVPAER